MEKPKDFELTPGHAVFRPTGKFSLEEAAQLITSALAYSCEQKVRKLLVDIRYLTGFDPPNLGTRYFFFREWARVAEGRVRVAFVARPEMIDSEKIGITIGENAGLRSDAFTLEEDALTWLESVE